MTESQTVWTAYMGGGLGTKWVPLCYASVFHNLFVCLCGCHSVNNLFKSAWYDVQFVTELKNILDSYIGRGSMNEMSTSNPNFRLRQWFQKPTILGGKIFLPVFLEIYS